jgi:hypothetical protein
MSINPKMKEEILNLIDKQKYSEAYVLTKSQDKLETIYEVWSKIHEGHKFENIDRNINFENFDNEIIETVKLYIHLSQSNWNDELLSEFRRVAKMIIAETSSKLRNASCSNINGQILHNPNFVINPEIRIYIQDLIEHFNKKELYESKADLARVKAQLTLTMNLEKRFIGADMIQYGNFYENVKQYEDSTQIYYGVIHDFEEALDMTYKDKDEQLLELDLLKQAYEGVFRLTNNSDIQQKINTLNLVLSNLQNKSDTKQFNTLTTDNQSAERKSWYKKLFGN